MLSLYKTHGEELLTISVLAFPHILKFKNLVFILNSEFSLFITLKNVSERAHSFPFEPPIANNPPYRHAKTLHSHPSWKYAINLLDLFFIFCSISRQIIQCFCSNNIVLMLPHPQSPFQKNPRK